MRTKLLAALPALFALLTLGLGGCAHPVSLTPELAEVTAMAGPAPLPQKAGLLVTAEQRGREVVSPGGGGDRLSYYPYRDLEVGLYSALSQVFAGVSRVSGLQDPVIKSDGLSLIVVPEISTTSYSASIVTWPPTLFTVTLACTVKDASERTVASFQVQGEGRAEYDEFKRDFSLAAKRASTDAVKKLVLALRERAPGWR